MRYSRRYLAFIIIIALALLIKTNTWRDEYAEVKAFRGAELSSDIFSSYISKNVNESGNLTLTVDGDSYINQTEGLYVASDMSVMAELSFVRDIFSCSARGYDEKRVLLETGEDVYSFPIGSLAVTKNGAEYSLLHSATYIDGRYFLPIQELCDIFGFGYDWNGKTYDLSLSSEKADEPLLPKKYDLRDKERSAGIKDQGNASTCWAYAAIGALESSCLPEKPESFQAEDLIANNTYHRDAKDGGDYRIAASYFLSWTGPVMDGMVKKHVQEVHFFRNEDVERIKWAIFKDGGVSSPIYIDSAVSGMKGSAYYKTEKNAYYYSGDKEPNHDIVIIGWDDDFSADNFKEKPEGNGAFICQNSWGNNFGENGVFYVSYYDSLIGETAVSYVGVEDTNNFDNIYQTDLCGQVGEMGYGKNSIYAANIYHASADETVMAAGFYALSDKTKFKISVVPDYHNTNDLLNPPVAVESHVDERGYYTIRFDEGVPVSAGEDFAVVINIITEDTNMPLAIEYQGESLKNTVDITDGKGFVSKNGMDWESLEETKEANVCLKAYTIYSK